MKNNWKKFIQKTKNRKPIAFLSEIIKDENLKTLGDVLDLGCGAGVDSKFMAENGFIVRAVDSNIDCVNQTIEQCRELRVSVIQDDIINFNIESQKYSVIIAWYSLPFIKKTEVQEIFKIIQNGLKKDGYFVFGLLGPEDGWREENSGMSFFVMEEAKNILSGMQFVKIAEKKETGPSATGEIKFWHKIYGYARKK